MLRGLSLKKTWTLLVLFTVILPVTVVMAWYGRQLYGQRLQGALTVERQTNELIAYQIESEVDRLKTLLQNKSDPISLILQRGNDDNRLKDINALLRVITERERAVREVIIVSPDSTVLAAVEPSIGLYGDHLLSLQTLEQVARHWGFDDHAQHPELVIPSLGRRYISSPEQHGDFIAFNIATPIPPPANAVLIAKIDVSRLWTNKRSDYGYGKIKAVDYILDRRGSLITEIEDSEYPVGHLMTHLAIARAALIDGSWDAQLPYIGVLNETVFGTLTTIPSLNWSLVSEVVASTVTQPILVSLVKIWAATLTGVMLFIWFAFYLASKTIRPIQEACKVINHVASGDYQHSIAECGIRELDAMSSGFNSMVKARQRAEQLLLDREISLIESRQRYQSLFDKSADASLIIEDMKFSDCNQATLDMLGYDHKGDVVGKTPAELSPEYQPDGELSSRKAQLMLDTAIDEGSHRFEWLHQHRDGHTFPVEVLLTAISFEGKRILHAVFRDITDRKRQEEQLRRTQKMDALGKLTGGIAHDYNNMLGVVLGYAELLHSGLADHPGLQRYAEQITTAATRGANLTNKLLSFTRHSPADLKSLDIQRALFEIRDMLQKTLTPRIELVYDFCDQPWLTRIDESELHDAMLNMAINAMHAIQGNGRLLIKLRNVSLDFAHARNVNLSPGDYVQLSVCDSGCGMTQEVQERLFDPFFTTKGSEGTGLGLSQVYGFVGSSGGAVTVNSSIGNGTTFTLLFPRHRGERDSDDPARHCNVDITGTPRTVLVVDDEPALLDLCKEWLSSEGYIVLCANSAHAALRLMESSPVDILLSDVVMPEMDGYQLANAVQKKHPHIKIQMVSGFSDMHSINILDPVLHQNRLLKPYQKQELLTRLRALFC